MMASYSPLVCDGTSATHLSSSPVTLYHKPRIQRAGVLFFLSWFMSLAIAAVVDIAPLPTEAPFTFEGEPLLLDERMPVLERGSWTMLSHKEHELRRRAKEESGSTTTVEIPAPTATQKTTSTSLTPSPLPSPFDSSLASNFTGNNGNGACPAFINSFLTNPTFKECYPVSLLLQSSQSFFEAEKSLVRITQVLDASCAANVTFCTSYLTDLAKNLTDASNCGADYQLGNSVVVQAYIGMLSYQALYSATCLTDPDSSLYCFANAVTNLTTPSNMYIYYLPLNISLPATSSPSCSWCLQQTMGIYQSAAASKKQPVYHTYVDAAQQINTMCGPNFVNETLPAEIKTSFGHSSAVEGPSWLLLWSLSLIALRWLF